jgi:hypothetical protein
MKYAQILEQIGLAKATCIPHYAHPRVIRSANLPSYTACDTVTCQVSEWQRATSLAPTMVTKSGNNGSLFFWGPFAAQPLQENAKKRTESVAST